MLRHLIWNECAITLNLINLQAGYIYLISILHITIEYRCISSLKTYRHDHHQTRCPYWHHNNSCMWSMDTPTPLGAPLLFLQQKELNVPIMNLSYIFFLKPSKVKRTYHFSRLSQYVVICFTQTNNLNTMTWFTECKI